MIDFTPENRIGRRVLFTPGPLTTTRTVREAMTADIGSWDADCIELTGEIRSRLAALTRRPDVTCVLIQGSGSFGVEAMITSAVPRGGKLLILSNGAYGRRMGHICKAQGIDFTEAVSPDDRPADPAAAAAAIDADPAITHVAAVHCETTTGVLNPVREIGLAVQSRGRRFLVDAISSFAAYAMGPGAALDWDAGPIDHMAGSANKCVEGTPGFAFVLSRREAMEACAGNARSYCLAMHAQWAQMEKSGQFRTTPPTHVMLGFRQALRELEAEGGIAAREARYRENHKVLNDGMTRLGHVSLVKPEHQSHIITTYLYPRPDFDFPRFYSRLRERGYIIYPGKLTEVDTFRVGNIGSIGPEEIRGLLGAIEAVSA